MNLYEHEGKRLLARMGISVPQGAVVAGPGEAVAAARQIGFPVVAKCQVLSGGRGKAGGIKPAMDAKQLEDVSTDLLGLDLGGEPVNRLLIEKQLDISLELYAGITFDPESALPVLILSAQGGVEIETVAAKSPEALIKLPLDPLMTYRPHHFLALAKQAGLTGAPLVKVARVLQHLVNCYFQNDAITAEINPLAVLTDGEVCAADAKIDIDDAALYRHPTVAALERSAAGNPLEREARDAGVIYVRLSEEGSIGLICGGAGLGMASMDAIYHHGGIPANFLDLGHATPEKTAAALEIVLKTPGVEGVFVNAYGGINNCGDIGEGIARVVDALKPVQAIVVKMRGHSQDKGWRLMADRNIPVVKYGTTGDGISLLMERMQINKEARHGHID